MKKNEKTIVILNAILIFLAIAILLIWPAPDAQKVFAQTVLAVVFAVISVKTFKLKKTNKAISITAVKSVVIIMIASLIVGFNLGLIVGFTKTFFPPSGQTLFLGLIPTAIIIVASEFYRKSILTSAFDNKKLIIFSTITLTIISISIELNLTIINSIETIFIATSTIVLPAIAENLLATYLVTRAGIKPALAYRLPRSLYLYVLPIAPAFSQYLYSVMWVIVPYFSYLLVRKYLPEDSKKAPRLKDVPSYRRQFSLLAAPIIIILLTLVTLTSGITRYKMIAIASGSMSPTYDRGDAVIYDKNAELEVGEVLAFEHEGRIVTHRIIKISKNGSEKIYYTKGDANETSDDYAIREKSVLGEVKCIVKYIGIPTVWFNETIGNIQ